MSWRVNELDRGRVGGWRRVQEEEEVSGMIWSSVNETNDLCIKMRNSLTYDNCAMKPMNRNGKQEMKLIRGSEM